MGIMRIDCISIISFIKKEKIKILLTKEVKIKWNPINKKWYQEKGYIFTKMKEDFIVKIEDLSKGCHSLIEVKCDCEYCDSPIKTMTWNNYNNNLKESGKYFVKEVYWKCNNNKHDDFKRKISYSTDADFNCPNCQIYKGEEKIKQYLINNDIIFQFQKTFDNLLGLGNGLLSYDFYLPLYNLLIEVQGKQHEKPIEHFGGEKQFIIQQEHDKRKKEYAINNNINFLEIWYWDFDRIEEILQKEL